MKSCDIFMLTAEADTIIINRNELAQRLGVSRGYQDELVTVCEQRLKRVLNYKGVYIRVPVDMSKQDVCDFGFMKAESHDLYKNLSGCREVFVFAVTAGITVDRELAKLKILSQAEHFVTDAIASAAVDSFCEYFDKQIKQDLRCARRFSPGYGDLSLSLQLPLLERLNAHQLLGITLDAGFMMTPVKSITAIMGIKE